VSGKSPTRLTFLGNLDALSTQFNEIQSIYSSISKPLNLSIHLYHTQNSKEQVINVLTPMHEPTFQLHIQPSRPDLLALLKDVMANTEEGGVGVGACGPVQMVLGLEKLVRELDKGEKKRVGGVEMHSERFSL
jgi:hypothetical protein